MTKRLMDGGVKVNRETVKRALLDQVDATKDNPDHFIDELAHMISDYHDFQLLSRKVARGK